MGKGVLRGFSSDTSVQGTNDDAQVSKLSCTKAGYFRDDFISFFVKRSARRSPLINRGYFARYSALRQLLLDFLRTAGKDAQVLSLGAGFDTAWWQIAQDQPELLPARYLEVDFQEVTKCKASIVEFQPRLLELLDQHAGCGGAGAAAGAAEEAEAAGASGAGGTGAAAAVGPAEGAAAAAAGPSEAGAAAAAEAESGAGGASGVVGAPGEARGLGEDEAAAASTSGVCVDAAGGSITSERYRLAPVDMSQGLSNLAAAIEAAGLDRNKPTFILSECVLVYMDPADSAAIVRWLGGHFKCAAMAVYEQLSPEDAFGQQMCSNLESRGCPLRGVYSTPTKDAHEARMTSNGWGAAQCRTMDEIYTACLDPVDKARIEKLEMFDEFEEWHMIMEHYCITVAVNSGPGGEEAAGSVLTGFGLREVPQPAPPVLRLPLVD
ncbi:hypothetical protein FOA52_012454 [Chlamydomonas sp. UWO 241]|nr:hypothetical protein FOA52_012454 [Chlamydomonas sp. UWO 241]